MRGALSALDLQRDADDRRARCWSRRPMRRRSQRPPCCSMCSPSSSRPETARGGSRPAWPRGSRLLSKYTAFFLGLGMLFWLLAVPSQRRWLRSFWPYLGGRHCASDVRARDPVERQSRLDFVPPAIRPGRIGRASRCAIWANSWPGQIGLASPFIAILGVAGLVSIARSRRIEARADRRARGARDRLLPLAFAARPRAGQLALVPLSCVRSRRGRRDA